VGPAVVSIVAGLVALIVGAFEPAASARLGGVSARPVQLTPDRAGKRRPRRAPRPTRIEIPAIGVRAPVVPLGIAADRTLEVPTRFGDTGWWTGGARPGEAGPAIVVGHVDSRTGPAVFYRLRELGAGDAITFLRRDGTRVRFVVRRIAHYPKDRFPTAAVYGATRRATLRLITCSGSFDRASGHYLDNTVVYADRG
jgi:sortase (surface protein transpeptidase)